ncbi:MAG: NTP transferase domain-containing protein [Candidatus Rokubacteria bacterium]|nr:NTP transferase domain-containing protein [Candidatus Rokubacteria bacterium]
MRERETPLWALILAGGDGTRLRPLTSQIAGDARPKQFCAVLDGETLLDRTRRRADRLVRFDRQAIVVTRAHEPFYAPLVRELAPARLVVQPDNRGTAPGIIYPLLRVLELAGDAPVIVMPSDHYVSDDAAFMAYAARAVDAVRARRSLVTLLGVEPSRPETEYGWIAPAEMPLPIDGEPVFAIRRFIEKPDAPTAAHLHHRGCLWNSFVMVGWASAFLDLVAATQPALVAAFASLRRVLGTPVEEAVAARVYAALPVTGFSEGVLAPGARRLGVVRVKGVEWSDWGHPRRVLASLGRAGLRPAWLDRVRLAEAG